MPTYEVTDPASGKKVRLTGDSPPTDAELEQIFAGINTPQQQGLGDVFGDLQPVQQGPAQASSTAPTAAPQEGGILAGIKEAFTGEQRATEATRTLPDWANMPEMNELSATGLKTGLATLTGSPQEVAQIIKANYPNTQVRQDEKGNYILKSSMDGAEYAIKPGFQMSDIPRAGGVVAAFSPAGAARSMIGRMAAGAATQGAIESGQAASGGQLNPEEVLLAGAIPGVTGTLAAGARAAKGSAQQMLGTAAPPVPVRGLAEAEAAKIPFTTSDAFPPKNQVSNFLVGAGERIPVAGTGSVRAGQQDAREQAVRQLFTDYGSPEIADASEKVMKDLLGKRSDDLTRYSGMKGDVINRLSDPQLPSVPVVNAVAATDREIARLSSLRLDELNPVIAKLENWKDAIQGQGLDNIESLRKVVGESFKSAEMAGVRSEAEKSLSSIYGPLRTDMGEFIKTHGQPQDFNKWSVANKQLSIMTGELEKAGLKSMIKRGEATPEIIQNALFSKRPSDARTLYNSLTQDGKSQAKRALIAKAISDAGGIEDLSTAKFATSIKKLGAPIGIMFNGDELARVQGLRVALRATRRAETAALNPQTGATLAVPAVVASLAQLFGGGGVAAVGAMAGAGGLARAYESKPVRNLLIALSRVPPESAEEAAIISKLNTALQAAQNQGSN